MKENRAGHYRKNLSGEMTYYSFVPNALPPNPALNVDDEMILLLTKANRSIATLVSATLYAIDRLKTLPLCNRLIRESHEVLMKNVRGQYKNPGEFRKSKNWIGGQGSTIQTARYIPPTVQDMTTAMSDLEKFMNADDMTDILIKAALIHYQFETIHPFLDGNGRVGRLLITLFLLDKNFLCTPVFYISYFLKRNRIEYYDRMSEVRLKGNYEQWVKFFLTAADESARDAIDTIKELAILHEKNIALIEQFGRARITTLSVFEYLERSPIIEIGKTARALNLSFNAVSSAVNRLKNIGVLAQVENASRNRIFAYSDYLTILKKGT